MAIFSLANGQAERTLFLKRTYVDAQGDTLLYRIAYPDRYDRSEKYPLILFLHGAGERGTDNEAQLTHGSQLFLASENRKQYPAIVVFPQCRPEPDYWAHMILKEQNGVRYREFPVVETPKPSLQRVIELLKQLQQTEAIDANRLYVMGLSMGAMGTFELLWRLPDTFAAAIPICGGGNVVQVTTHAKTTSLWLFHGDKDDVVLPEYSRQLFEALRAAGADVQYTEYLGVKHDSWNWTFREEGLLKWLFSKQLSK